MGLSSVFSFYLPSLVHGFVRGFLGSDIVFFCQAQSGPRHCSFLPSSVHDLVLMVGVVVSHFYTCCRYWGLMFPHIVSVAYKGSLIFIVLGKVFHSNHLESVLCKGLQFL